MGGAVMITLRQLEIFEKVATTEHVTKASKSLFLSQSAVSMSISELEQEFSGVLFERRGRRLILNERGRMLLPRAREVLQKVNSITKMMKESAEVPIGVLHIGASTTIGNYLLPTLMGKFSKIFPRAQVVLHVGNTEQVELGVQNGDLDLGLVEGPSHLPTLESVPWLEDELVVIAGLEHPWAKTKEVTAEMLGDAQWIKREKGSGTREVFEAAMAELVKTFDINMELGHTEAIKKAVEAGLGVSCLSRLAIQRELENNWLVEVNTPLDLKRQLTFLLHKDKDRSKLFDAFISLLLSSTNNDLEIPNEFDIDEELNNEQEENNANM